MIARVRIAPVEHWCEPSRSSGIERGAPEVGMTVEIDTSTMHMPEGKTEDCNGRFWDITPSSGKKLRAIVGWEWRPYEVYTVCEHMLEMD